MFIVAVDDVKNKDLAQKNLLEKQWTDTFNTNAKVSGIPAKVYGFNICDNNFTLSIFPSLEGLTPSYCNVIDLLRMTIPHNIAVVNNADGQHNVQPDDQHDHITQFGDIFTPTVPKPL